LGGARGEWQRRGRYLAADRSAARSVLVPLWPAIPAMRCCALQCRGVNTRHACTSACRGCAAVSYHRWRAQSEVVRAIKQRRHPARGNSPPRLGKTQRACMPSVHRVPAAAVRHDCVAAGKFNFAGRPRPSSRRPLAAVCGQLAVAGGHLDGLLAIINHSSIVLLKTSGVLPWRTTSTSRSSRRVCTPGTSGGVRSGGARSKVAWVGELAESDPMDLTGAYLPSAHLPGADLTMVDLSGADLECAGLIGAGPIQGDPNRSESGRGHCFVR
jgi:Pentapeptide repeats (8 copies)